MSDILERFGVTEDLVAGSLRASGLSPRTADRATDVTRASLERAVELITPVRCGIPLMRIGPKRDGGYLVPDDLDGIEACFSPGVANFKDFEDDLARRFGVKSFMCDYTSDVELLRTPLIDGLQRFEKKWLDVGPSENNLDINDWVRANSSPGADLLLQMDIEGAEYRNLLHATDETLSRFRIIVLEVHSLQLLLESEFLYGIFLPVFERLARHFVCVHAHENNCCTSTKLGPDLIVPNVLELTLLRRDRVRNTPVEVQLPHAMDALNVVSRRRPRHLKGAIRRNADVRASRRNARRLSARWAVLYGPHLVFRRIPRRIVRAMRSRA
ncbi:hypothetical protein [Agromyces larvae]|uniref:Methyltransferase FkbM domain-containing protein n=1 Tax=Agromyces larvae TaxID=2929802 RepID=A0ABY4C2S8_9MICO|nr:hypothetical protein [Agromyces larvae]UOE44321.1 hypothetical protein MTO99_00560 [Agromyces larvae]